jgi:4-hydroxybenzoate polyprenyltransferase
MFPAVRLGLNKNLFLHLRLPFSFFLMPIYLFGASQVAHIDWVKAFLIFFVLHFIVYPASNLYNSFMDKDSGSISCLENPPPVSKDVLYTSFFLDILGLLLAYYIAIEFLIAVGIYTIVSKAYSWKKIRLKKYPFTSWMAVVMVQGGLTFFIANQFLEQDFIFDYTNKKLWLGLLICCVFTGGQYPLTQVYQHKQDLNAGDHTLSMYMGIKGTFIFASILFLIAGIFLFFYFLFYYQLLDFLLFVMFFWPVITLFSVWVMSVFKDEKYANYKQTMKFLILNACCMNGFFLVMLIINQI